VPLVERGKCIVWGSYAHPGSECLWAVDAVWGARQGRLKRTWNFSQNELLYTDLGCTDVTTVGCEV
jgi:hypothetical protein